MTRIFNLPLIIKKGVCVRESGTEPGAGVGSGEGAGVGSGDGPGVGSGVGV